MVLKEVLVLECDILVIGGGLSGCWAALKAKEYAPKVILVEKGKVSRSGKSSFSGAILFCPQAEDDFDLWHREIVEQGEYVCDQDWVSILIQEQQERIKDLENWGVLFERDEKGRLVRHSTLGQTYSKGAWVDSFQMMEALRKRLELVGVSTLDRIMVTDLLTSDGCYPTKGNVIGAFGFHTRNGEPYAINAKATVVASGGTGHFNLSGDGIAQAFRAGAEVYGMEFTRTFDNLCFEGKYLGVHLATFQRLGFHLLNSQGERFMERYQPQLKEKVKRQDLGLAIVAEGMAGRGPIYMDMTHLDADSLHKLRTLPGTASRVQAVEREGLDFSRQKIKFHVTSGFIHVDSGGIRNNIWGESNISGLYVAGEAGGFPASGAGTIPTKLATCCVSGYRAGEYAARYAREQPIQPVNEEQVRQIQEKAMRPLKAEKGLRPQVLWEEVEGFLSLGEVSIFRSATSIKSILAKCKEWENKADILMASDLHDLMKVNNVRSYITCANLIFRASLEREETRGLNIRIDHPYRDDINWLKWTILRKDQEKGIVTQRFPLPIYRYPVKPEKYAKISVNIPLPKTMM